MVTIDPNKPMLNATEPNRAESRSNVKKGEFDALFRQAVDSTEAKGVETESARFISQIRPVQFTTDPLPSADRVVDRVQRLIDTMGVYQQKLIESRATLKDIQPLVQEMESQSQTLSAASNAVEGQKNLKTIVNQSLTIASMEIAKFNSGYYNNG